MAKMMEPTTSSFSDISRNTSMPFRPWSSFNWYFKRRIQEIEGIGVERDLAGLPTLTAPEGMNIWDEDDPEMAAIRVAAAGMA